MTEVQVRPMVAEDWPAVSAIYAQGIATGNATFESEAPSWQTFDEDHSPTLRLVAVKGEHVIGWAAVRPVSDRCVYSGVAEHSVYVDPESHGRGVGRTLLEALIQRSEAEGVWTLQAGVFPENSASLALHGACGFRIVGRRVRIGEHHGRWRDVLWIERRSSLVGPA